MSATRHSFRLREESWLSKMTSVVRLEGESIASLIINGIRGRFGLRQNILGELRLVS